MEGKEFTDEYWETNVLTRPDYNQLRKITLENTSITHLVELPRWLRTLIVSDNQLQSLPPLPNDLVTLDITNNKIETIPSDLPNTLRTILAKGNPLLFIPQLNDGLTRFEVSKELILPLYQPFFNKDGKLNIGPYTFNERVKRKLLESMQAVFQVQQLLKKDNNINENNENNNYSHTLRRLFNNQNENNYGNAMREMFEPQVFVPKQRIHPLPFGIEYELLSMLGLPYTPQQKHRLILKLIFDKEEWEHGYVPDRYYDYSDKSQLGLKDYLLDLRILRELYQMFSRSKYDFTGDQYRHNAIEYETILQEYVNIPQKNRYRAHYTQNNNNDRSSMYSEESSNTNKYKNRGSPRSWGGKRKTRRVRKTHKQEKD